MAAGYPPRGTAWVTSLLKIPERAAWGRAIRLTYRFYAIRFTFEEMS